VDSEHRLEMEAASVRPAFGAKPGSSRADESWHLGRRLFTREFWCFVVVGLICTVLYLLAYRFLRLSLPPLGANVLALVCTAGPNFTANRILTFQVRSGSVFRQAGQYVVFYIVGIAASSLALATFLLIWAAPPREVEYLAVLGSIGFSTVIRYVAMSSWVFPANLKRSLSSRE
jgi:putative flippase GtrA